MLHNLLFFKNDRLYTRSKRSHQERLWLYGSRFVMSNRIPLLFVQSFLNFSSALTGTSHRLRSTSKSSPWANSPPGEYFNGNPSGISRRAKLCNKKFPQPWFSPANQLERNFRSVVRVLT